jgi:ATP-dependent protease HslVU (ClpYQ) peptidase subunit
MAAMTCIVAVRDPGSGSIVMGADSMTAFGWSADRNNHPKIFKRESGAIPIYMGASGDVRWSDILRYSDIPNGAGHEPAHEWAVTKLVPALREAATKAGYTKKEGERETNGQMVIVVFDGDILSIGADWSVHWPAGDYWAIGCGSQFAEGALAAMEAQMPDMIAIQRAVAAIEAAIRHSIGCAHPIHIVECLP